MRLIVSIDTECDCSRTWNLSSPVTFKGVSLGIGKILQPLFDEFGVKPVYFVSHEVMEDDESRERLCSIADRCELASHLHVAFIEPDKRSGPMAGVGRHEMQRQYPFDVEYAKMKNLTELFKRSFGVTPCSFRAGRYGISRGTGRILMELGYKVDSSVTPHIRWKDPYVKDAPDFSILPEQPYKVCESGDIWRSGDSSLLEIPITVRLWKRKLSRFWRKQVRWLRPWYSSCNDLGTIINNEIHREQEAQKESLLVMMFHNMEVIPGASPYPQTEYDVEQYVNALRYAISYAGKHDVKFSTMREYYENIMGGVQK
jgi:AraC-like DNA-binding protein